MCLYLKSNPVTCKAVLSDLNEYCIHICVPAYDFLSVTNADKLGNLIERTEEDESPQLFTG